MVEIEQSAQTLPPLNVGGQAHRRWRSLQELVVESLVVSLAMGVVDVLAHEETHVPFAEGDDATETLLFHRADEPLGIRGEIGTLRRETERLDTPALEDLAKDPRVERVAVVHQIAGASQAAIDRVRQIAGPPAMQAGLATRRLTLRDIFVSLRSLVSSLSDVLTLAHSRRMAAAAVMYMPVAA